MGSLEDHGQCQGTLGNIVKHSAIKRLQPGTCFFDLSGELRNLVYGLYLLDTENFESPNSNEKPLKFPKDEKESDSIIGAGAGIYDASKVLNVDPTDARDVLQINQEGYLHCNIPSLCRVSRATFSETMPLIYNKATPIRIHVNSCDPTFIYQKRGAIRLLETLCALQFTESNTMIILHGPHPNDCVVELERDHKRYLVDWIRQFWYHGRPLFNERMEIMHRGHWGADEQFESGESDISRRSLRIVKYLRMLYEIDRVRWRTLSVELFRDVSVEEETGEGDKREIKEPVGDDSQIVHRMTWGIAKYVRMEERHPNSDPKGHPSLDDWRYVTHRFERARSAVVEVAGDSFETSLQAHMDRVL
ncbi:hypothetical protein P154DRAFT_567936 [Amniculicola lignicola CBS 123094]|uniref:Uncharacterized protein n=1 Tax=Amniculicola lignicola CBS 123094 TaxID=1392246 RepID=A0A6A5VXX3_9PLEO|nr:hypothetical protein P154DRAFT_567936 [Amniculicola lignicola CBS 123094]